MKFTMNNREWEILEVEQKEMCDLYGEEVSNYNKYFGITVPEEHKIYLWNDIPLEEKRKTLIHELTHCYLFSYISFNNINFSIDDFCDINGNSHDIIHKIIEDYFK